MAYTVAIIGRPNVGKSTLFNRLAGRRLALVDDLPGLTRDRKETQIRINRRDVVLTDTAGLEDAEPGSIAARMREQSEQAIAESDLILFVIDARAELTSVDRGIADLVRSSGKPFILVANKSESRASDAGYYGSYELGLGEPLPVSAEHNMGLGDLMAEVTNRLDEIATARGDEPEPEDDELTEEQARARPLKLAIAGRPNAGKSTLVNALLGEERMITGPEAGLTRDAIAADFQWRGRKVRLYDTAGLRRKARINVRSETLAVGDALRAIRFAEIVVLLLDAQSPFDKQDLTIADLVEREGRGLVFAVNKWDLVPEPQAYLAELRKSAERILPQLAGAPLVPVSAISGRGLDKVMDAAFKVNEAWNKRISTAALNRWFATALDKHQPPAVAGRRLKLRYITQSNARPPTFIVFSSRPEALPDSYLRYLVNDLKKSFGLGPSPVRLHVRKTNNPYADEGGRSGRR
ncbi:ribosome biogenesis GTPase Der [Rhodomicrobium vannielii ATCC 17100]|uniref:ribosome biogenesis GTPase Der n=1 Tax=Rhodomicrobium vannielii TaxID=1069 RepID=UPI001918CB2F|nr:ribosome biogenesis GTPase Der [Rhodomicrobium vannielii]MBJ7534344.1 ribosome biogenesis GTPase Der [Rhodomicrobium vannielii ATCC 17100]